MPSESSQTAAAKYSDLQSAVRFPIQLPIAVKSQLGESHTQSQNIPPSTILSRSTPTCRSVLPVDFTISMPADVLGAESDVQIDCRGHVHARCR